MASRRKDRSTHEHAQILPSEVVEVILVRLPLKSILRFKTVSKLWNAMITSPEFTKIQSQSSSSSQSRILVRECPPHLIGFGSLCLLKYEEDQSFQRGAVLKVPFDHNYILCSCNGILLLGIRPWSNITYMLWNPCSRMHTTLRFPDNSPICIHGLCHDPTTDDYKVVMVSGYDRFSVFSCKKQAWTKRERDFPPSKHISTPGVYVNGAFYWILYDYGLQWPAGIISFDGIHDMCDRMQLPMLIALDDSYSLHKVFLVCMRGCLGVCFYYHNNISDKIVIPILIMERKNGGIASFKKITLGEEQHWTHVCGMHTGPGHTCPTIRSPCPVNDNRVMLFIDATRYVIYDAREEKIVGGVGLFSNRWKGDLVCCKDRLFFPIQKVRP